VEAKEDHSPLTQADKDAHEAIVAILKDTAIPILSEEGSQVPYEERRTWEYLWIVDPLDGTKEFLKRNGEFTVNIALVHRNLPVLGVVAVPVTGDVYYSTIGTGAYLRRDGMIRQLPIRKPVDLQGTGIRVVASRSHLNEETQQYIKSLSYPELVSKGSSIKFMLLAEGQADVYPRFGPTMEWDTAAAHAIVVETGMSVQHSVDSLSRLTYNKENLLNPHFIVLPPFEIF
jgi:3'(2'), 5'-bisphosphate nucleotidase